MAYIDGAYTTSATILKDLARVLSTANILKEPVIEEQVIVQAEDNTLFIETQHPVLNGALEGEPVLISLDFYELDGVTFRGDIVAVGYVNNDTYKISELARIYYELYHLFYE